MICVLSLKEILGVSLFFLFRIVLGNGLLEKGLVILFFKNVYI